MIKKTLIVVQFRVLVWNFDIHNLLSPGQDVPRKSAPFLSDY